MAQERSNKQLTKSVSFRRQSRPEMMVLPNFHRSASQDSSDSSASSAATADVVHKDPLQEVRRQNSSGSSASSLGLSFLMTRGGRYASDISQSVSVPVVPAASHKKLAR